MVISISSCSKKPSNFVEAKPENKTDSVLYIYRPHSMSNIMISPDVLIDGEKKVEIKNKSYFYMLIPQAKHSVKLGLTERFTGVQQLELNVEQGETVYLRVNTSLKFEMNKPYSRSFSIESVDKEQALDEIKKTRYADKKIETPELDQASKAKSHDEEKKSGFSTSKTNNPFSK